MATDLFKFSERCNELAKQLRDNALQSYLLANQRNQILATIKSERLPISDYGDIDLSKLYTNSFETKTETKSQNVVNPPNSAPQSPTNETNKLIASELGGGA